MLNTGHLISDTQLSNEDASQMIVANAIEQLSSITGLNKQQCLSLLSSSVGEHAQTNAHPHQAAMTQNNIIDQYESEFIVGLFSD